MLHDLRENSVIPENYSVILKELRYNFREWCWFFLKNSVVFENFGVILDEMLSFQRITTWFQ